jgi:hypothetical protein
VLANTYQDVFSLIWNLVSVTKYELVPTVNCITLSN